MAQLTGVLGADFSSFTKAVDDAVVHLKAFETGGAKVGDALQRMTDRLDGRKLIQDAVLMAEAVEAIGGASKLTDKELQKLGGTATEAIEKMRKIGVEVPPGLQAIADGAKKAERATIDWKGALLSAAGALGIAFSVSALKNFAVGVIDTGARIGDMSEKLGISAEAVQRFGYAADQSGASIETVDRAIKAMNVNLAEGSDSTVGALKDAGLQFDAIRRMSPEQAFVAIGDAVARIEDPMRRAQVATELFGKAGQELIPTFLAGIQQVGSETTAMSDETVKRLKEAQDAWGRLSTAVVTYSGQAIAGVVGLVDAYRRGSKELAAMEDPNWIENADIQAMSDFGAQMATIPAPARAMAEGLRSVALTEKQAAIEIAVMNASLPIQTEAMKRAAEARARLAEMAKAAMGPEFAWQEQILLTKWKVDQLTVSEIRFTEELGTLTDFIATHQGEMFPEPSEGNLEKWKQGELAILKIVPAASTLRSDIDTLSQSFADLGQIGGEGLSKVTRGIGTLIGATNTAFSAVGSLKNSFTAFSGGGLMSGIASLASGIGGIVGVASAAIGAVKALWSSVHGGEEGQVVNPARDRWFAEHGGSVEGVADRLAGSGVYGEDARRLIDAVFQANTGSAFGAATGEIDRILAYQGNSFAGGSGGFRDFGSGTLAMLHGREAVVPEGSGLGGNVVIQINAQGAFFDTPGDLQRLAEKVNDALTAKYGLTNRNRAA